MKSLGAGRRWLPPQAMPRGLRTRTALGKTEADIGVNSWGDAVDAESGLSGLGEVHDHLSVLLTRQGTRTGLRPQQCASGVDDTSTDYIMQVLHLTAEEGRQFPILKGREHFMMWRHCVGAQQETHFRKIDLFLDKDVAVRNFHDHFRNLTGLSCAQDTNHGGIIAWQVVNKRKRDEPKASQSDQKESQSDQKASRARSRRRWAQLAQLAQLAVAEGWSGEVADFQKQ